MDHTFITLITFKRILYKLLIRMACSESMLRKSSFLWSSIRNRRVLRDGEPLLDCGWDDDDDIYDNVDDGEQCSLSILLVIIVMITMMRMIMESWSCSCSQGLLWKCLGMVLWVGQQNGWLRFVVLGRLTLYDVRHNMITLSRNPNCSFRNGKWYTYNDKTTS